jgi:hypothetical protein
LRRLGRPPDDAASTGRSVCRLAAVFATWNPSSPSFKRRNEQPVLGEPLIDAIL